MSTYFNPNKFPFQDENLGTILGMAHGQVGEVVQENGVLGGEPLFKPPKAMRDWEGIWAAIEAADRPKMKNSSVLSLNAKNSSGTLIFTTGMAQHLVTSMLGIGMINVNKTPPRTKTGWYSAADAEATKFGALNITFYEVGQAVSIARDDVIAAKMGASLAVLPGDLVMAAYAATADFGKCAPLLTTTKEVDLTLEGGGSDDVPLTNPWAIEVLSVVGDKDPTYNRWDSGTILVPGATGGTGNCQLQGIDISDQGAGAPTKATVHYKYWALGRLIPLSMIFKGILGKTIMASGVNAEVIGLEVW